MSEACQMGDRLKFEMKKKGITSAELARRSGVLTSFIYDIVSGKSGNPSTIKLARIADSLGVSLTYLVRGEEDRYETTAADSDIKNFVNIPYIPSGITNIKYLFNKEWIKVYFDAELANLRTFIVNSDNMEPTLLRLDTVLLDISKKEPSPPGIFIICDDLGLTAKRLEYIAEKNSSYISVISDNHLYSTYECSASEINVVGRVVWLARGI